jgi:1,4-alpha-glucan branching enzyme
MIKTALFKGKGAKKVGFEFYAPQAQQVQVAGNFNGWTPSKTPLKQERDGKWKATLELTPGRYEYRFWVDGSWQNDQRVPNPFGTWNCILEIR